MRGQIYITTTLVGALALEACATRYLPPPAAPARVAPQGVMAAPPLHEGEGTVTFDSEGERARVERVTSRAQFVNLSAGLSLGRRSSNMVPTTQYTLAPLCETPCAVNLPLGSSEVLFSSLDPSSNRSSTAFVQVSSQPTVVRHAMGMQSTSVWGLVGSILMGGFSGAALLTGGALLLLSDSRDARSSGLDTAGLITVGVGAALAAGAVALGLASRPEQQPGATTQWAP